MSKGRPAAELLSYLCCRWPVRVLVRTRACGLLGGVLGGCRLDAVRVVVVVVVVAVGLRED